MKLLPVQVARNFKFTYKAVFDAFAETVATAIANYDRSASDPSILASVDAYPTTIPPCKRLVDCYGRFLDALQGDIAALLAWAISDPTGNEEVSIYLSTFSLYVELIAIAAYARDAEDVQSDGSERVF